MRYGKHSPEDCGVLTDDGRENAVQIVLKLLSAEVGTPRKGGRTCLTAEVETHSSSLCHRWRCFDELEPLWSVAPVPWDFMSFLHTPNISAPQLAERPQFLTVLFKLPLIAIVTNVYTLCASRSRSGRIAGALFSSSELSTVTSSHSAVVFNISAWASSTNGEVPRCFSVGEIVCRSQCMNSATKNP